VSLAQLNPGPLSPSAPLLLIVGAFTVWFWGRYFEARSGKPVALLAVTLSSVIALAVFVGQQAVDANRVLAGPVWMHVPGRAPITIDFSFHIDHLSLFWLVLVTGLGALTIALDRPDRDRGQLMWQLLALAGAQLILLTDNLVVLFAFWEFTQVAIWRLTDREQAERSTSAPPMLWMALAADLPLLVVLVVSWLNFSSFQISALTDAEALAARDPDQLASLVLLGYCVFGAAYARCLQFPFCTPVLHVADTSRDTVKTILGTVVVPIGLYLLFRFQIWIAAWPATRTLLVGAGCLSALLWSGMALTQPTLVRSVVSFLAGTVGLTFIGIGTGALAPSLLLSITVVVGCWAMLQLNDCSYSLARKPPFSRDPQGSALPPPEPPQSNSRFALRAAAVIAVILTSGLAGQETILNAAWFSMHAPASTASPEASTDDRDATAPEDFTVGPVVPDVMLLAHFLLSLALFRGLFRRASVGESASAAIGSRLTILLLLIIGVAAGPLLVAINLRNGNPLPITAPGVMAILMILALLLAFILYSRPTDWLARIENACGGLASLSRRAFYVDELIQLIWVLPWTVLGWLAVTGDRKSVDRLRMRLLDLQAGVRQSLRDAFAEGPLAACILSLVLGAAVMIVLLIQG
jgi:NADH:ubiquinone oxidoreductase subunit 5 (subunit L)/multisubunit Na+/H+ antiporter MnhA subunit